MTALPGGPAARSAPSRRSTRSAGWGCAASTSTRGPQGSHPRPRSCPCWSGSPATPTSPFSAATSSTPPGWYDGLTGFVSNYVAAIGGNDHNYQRYPVLQRDGRTIQYVVNGGGGAYLPATHPIPNMDRLAPAVHEEAFRCYPLRGDSLAHFSRRYDRLLRFGRGGPRRGFPLPAGEAPVPYNWSSLLFDTDEPPMFKSFLRLDATADEIVLSCWAATGCLEHERAPVLEDRARARRGPDGTWRWASETPGRPVP